jgi:hypothetical protein
MEYGVLAGTLKRQAIVNGPPMSVVAAGAQIVACAPELKSA